MALSINPGLLGWQLETSSDITNIFSIQKNPMDRDSIDGSQYWERMHCGPRHWFQVDFWANNIVVSSWIDAKQATPASTLKNHVIPIAPSTVVFSRCERHLLPHIAGKQQRFQVLSLAADKFSMH